MKRIYFTLIALMATLVASAQVIKVYEYDANGNLSNTPAYVSDKKVKVVFKEQEHEYVDLGLPSKTLWATCNVGATKPEEFGDYFAWGETKPKSYYSWDTYKWLNEGQSSWQQINKYTFADGATKTCWYSGSTFIGDNKTELDPEDDAATANWGSDWRMPSFEQIEELCNREYTDIKWTTLNGVDGCLITSKKNENSIFFPAAGHLHEGQLWNVPFWGGCWSRELCPDVSDAAWLLVINSSIFSANEQCRDYGHSVRPVRVKE